ncbi:YozE family protein [Bacillus sp. B1-b2]|uniref:YozE family protein n=1 Tax=Bacillus sp. B1-b2 TaxID=2653201 RepID=UPI0012626137|nr:YozE family protein [Bacillus sp. B1-b2]KAB7673032.1 YozE family protein [Bacillus sp. B1-b2]
MTKSFYHFLMKFRHPEPIDKISEFANHAYHDHDFPKNSFDYDRISDYLELNGYYLESMRIFDEAWELYLVQEDKKSYIE